MKNIKYLFIFFILSIVLIIFSVCKSDFSNEAEDETDGNNIASALIGTAGGTIPTDTGASIIVPEGGVVLSPDGLNFQNPFTITISLNNTMTG